MVTDVASDTLSERLLEVLRDRQRDVVLLGSRDEGFRERM